ncbi:LysR family transcriptional regulator ArgP [Gynuella sunshinyii]|uniref:Transcriptional regulator n=1 Tax=Gynuella sunshinyii YC6258 TaxID=1445510 RepID=A0A0C5VHU0_9GAMM|nr:LysR family transcriptional regulator ArgP [Gynuella sunshinyii]AJQ93811.1 transcriptional regulator [Gynuella sunshinyii YC6258]
MIDIRQLQALAGVIDEQGFDKAARKLGLTQSAVSQRIKQLERQLGKILLIRSTPPSLTHDGIIVMKYFRQMEHLQHEMLNHYQPPTGQRRTLAIGVNADSLATWLLDALDPLIQSEQLLIDIRVDDQDRTHDLLLSGEVLGCVSSSNSPVNGCNCYSLGTMTYLCLIAPAFKQRHQMSDDVSATQLQTLPCLEFNHEDGLEKRYLEHYFGITTPVPTHRIPSVESYLDFIRRGHAWGMIPAPQAYPALENGELIELKPGTSLQVPLFWHIWDLKSELARKLTETLTRYARHFVH